MVVTAILTMVVEDGQITNESNGNMVLQAEAGTVDCGAPQRRSPFHFSMPVLVPDCLTRSHSSLQLTAITYMGNSSIYKQVVIHSFSFRQ